MTARLAFALASVAATTLAGGATKRAPEKPETVTITLHAKPGSDSAVADVIARHWATAKRLGLVLESPHLTLRGNEAGSTGDFLEVLTWRDASIPDAAPKEIQALWAEMHRLTVPRAGQPGLVIAEVVVIESR